MTTKQPVSAWRKLERVIVLLVTGYPQLIVAVPLSVGLVVHAISGLLGLEKPHGWALSDIVRGVGFVVALLLFAILALMYLVAVIYTGWRGNGRDRPAVNKPGTTLLDGVITRTALLTRIDALAATHELIGPVLQVEPQCHPPRRFFYRPVSSASQIALDFDYCVYSPKSALLPPRETLLLFDAQTRRFNAAQDNGHRPRALIGVHPCDLHAIRTLDEVFSRDHADEPYLARRRNTLIVGIDCARPCTPGVFCHDMKTNEAETGFDVMLYPLVRRGDASDPPDIGPEYGIVFGTAAGRTWLEGGGEDVVRPATERDEEDYHAYRQRKEHAFPQVLHTRRAELPALLEKSYDSLVWEVTGQRCYSCGSCNLVCPTCYCFDVQDQAALPPDQIARERLWDSCMLRDFALVAGNHNFRGKVAERLRHRVMRKGAWIEKRTGRAGCVGCARCDRACTAKISIAEIFNQLAEEAAHAHH
jgi:formate hydrogenlyase subunit 6/NADH:ubiquinone oxidoreductase subunit I